MTLTECSIKFDELKLIWRPAPHTARLVVGSVRAAGAEFAFEYDGPDVGKAVELGFQGYTGLPIGGAAQVAYPMRVFGSRLPSRERADFDPLVMQWGANRSMSDFELLGLTFGRLPTDMFEFIPLIHPIRGSCFFSDLAGIKNYAASDAFRHLLPNTALDLVPNPANEFDAVAIEVRHLGKHVAHVKRVHNSGILAAKRAGLDVSCSSERVTANGVVREVIVKIRYG